MAYEPLSKTERKVIRYSGDLPKELSTYLKRVAIVAILLALSDGPLPAGDAAALAYIALRVPKALALLRGGF